MKFAGIDASLTNTGIAVYDTVSEEYDIVSVSSSSSGNLLTERGNRLEKIANRVLDFIGTDVELVAIEGPAFSSNTGKVWDRAGLWWYIVKLLIRSGVEVIEIPPTTRAKYATGKGNAGKDEVLLAVSRSYPEADIKNNDEADAVIMCAIAARLKDSPVEDSLPKSKLDAMSKLTKD